MDADSRSTFALALLAASESYNAFSLTLPDFYSLKTAGLAHDPAGLAALRSGYIPATGIGLAIAGALSLWIKSPIPLLVAGASTIALVATYEHALPPEDRLDPVSALLAGLTPRAPQLPQPAPPNPTLPAMARLALPQGLV